MRVARERTRKGELKMLAFVTEIRYVWDACGAVVGGPGPGGTFDLRDVDGVVVALDQALVTIRTLDLEVFDASDPTAYRAARDDPASREGMTVRALTAPRNSAVHHADVIDPDVASAAGPVPGTADRYVINPQWKDRSELPDRMFEDQKRRHRKALADAYDSACAGVPVLDTLLDAFTFFDRLAPALARRRPDGSLDGFPLPPYPLAFRYRRLAPDWPTEREWDQRARAAAQAALPGGSRTVKGTVGTPDGLVLCGGTAVGHGRTESFTEDPEQVVRDVETGATYVVTLPDGPAACVVTGGALATAAGPVDLSSLPDLSGDSLPWADLWALCQDDAEHYRRQRDPA